MDMREVNNKTGLFLETMVRQGLYAHPKRLQFKMNRLFRDIDFHGKRVLDIGAGAGLYTFYAACQGAKEVVSIEPEADGSTTGVTEKFYFLQRQLGLENVTHKAATLQDFEADGRVFDVIMLYDSINHLDENACIHLLEDQESWNIYKNLCSKIFHMAGPGAKIIACDCGRNNFFDKINITNPFAPSIEWHKHQNPETWVRLLAGAGFTNPIVRWHPPNILGALGDSLLGNSAAAYFFTSHFQLNMEAS
jgi:SAM-dependent methyltransferase